MKESGKPCRRYLSEGIQTVQFGWPLGMTVRQPMGERRYEARSRISDRHLGKCFSVATKVRWSCGMAIQANLLRCSSRYLASIFKMTDDYDSL